MRMLMVDDDHAPGLRTPVSFRGRTVTGTQDEMEWLAEIFPERHPEIVDHDGSQSMEYGFLTVMTLDSDENIAERQKIYAEDV